MIGSRTTAVVGSVTIDEQVSKHGKRRVQVGGVPTYGGRTFASEGCPVSGVTNLTADDGAGISATLLGLGVGVIAGETLQMTAYRNTQENDGSRHREVVSVAEEISAQLIPAECLSSVGILHLGPLHAADLADDVLELAHASSGTVSFDVQGYVRGAVGGGVAPRSRVGRALQAAHIVKAERRELRQILEVFGVGVADLLETFAITELVETAGSEGGVVHLCGGRSVRFVAEPVRTVVDTTGAGDVFFAAYVHSRVRAGATPAAASRAAAYIAAKQVSGAFLEASRLALKLN